MDEKGLSATEKAQSSVGSNLLAGIYSSQLAELRVRRQKEYEQEVCHHEADIRAAGEKASGYLALAKCHQSHGQFREALAIFEKALRACRPSAAIYFDYITVLADSGCASEAMSLAEEAVQRLPHDLLLSFRTNLLLPALYQSEGEVLNWRSRFVEGLERLRHDVRLDTAQQRKNALGAVTHSSIFYLNYQGFDDGELLRQYGDLVRQVVAANYPEWMQPLSKAAFGAGRSLRVGYISRYFWNHTVGQLFLGWLQKTPQGLIKNYCYHIGEDSDHRTLAFRKAAEVFYHLPAELETVASQILRDRLQVLVYLDIGMHPLTRLLGALRLAPVQCVAWGHPVTSGLPTMDYFLSAASMEPPQAQQHYTEALVTLPKIGVSVEQPVIARSLLSAGRQDFGLKEDAILYFCGQSLFKYLPRYDYTFAAIARRCPRAQFVFMCHNGLLAENFRKRLARHFRNAGLDAGEHVVILPRQDQFSYWNLNVLSDVYLDSFAWSGGRTTLEAISCGLPLVTCPGMFMRGRHSYGILNTLGVTDTIAHNEREYVELAVDLGGSPEMRATVACAMRSRIGSLYEDDDCVAALCDFYQAAVRREARPRT